MYFAVFFMIRFLPVDRGRVSPSPFFFIQTIGYALPFSTLHTRLTDFPVVEQFDQNSKYSRVHREGGYLPRSVMTSGPEMNLIFASLALHTRTQHSVSRAALIMMVTS